MLSAPLSRRLSLLTLAAVLVMGACSSDKATNPAGTSPTTSMGGSDTTMAAATTTSTIADTTTTSSTTTTEPAPEPFELRSDGIGTLRFGDPAGDVISGLTDELGAPDTDESRSYPTADGVGGYLTADGEMGFAAPAGREVCWLFGLCAEFGGDLPGSLSFMGWTYGGDSAGTLTSPSGVTIGSRWSDFPAMSVSPGSCYTVGSGTVDGITLSVQSSGVAFGEFTEEGAYIENLPAPADVTVIYMEAGEIPIFQFGDC